MPTILFLQPTQLLREKRAGTFGDDFFVKVDGRDVERILKH